MWIDPDKIVGVVRHNMPDEVKGFDELTDVTRQIGANMAAFLAGEHKAGASRANSSPSSRAWETSPTP